MRKRIAPLMSFAFALALSMTGAPPSFSQANQAIFQDEQQMLNMQHSQLQQYQQQEQQYEQQVQANDSETANYRNYAIQRITALKKLRAAGGSPTRSLAQQTGELRALQQWLDADAETREQEQAHIAALDKCIANLQESETGTMKNLGDDITDMRQNLQDQRDDAKFNKTMEMNQFKEMKSEMGAETWGSPPRDGGYWRFGGNMGGMGGGGGVYPMLGGGRGNW